MATAATISPPASRTGSALSETMPREPSARTTSISLSDVDSPAERAVDELGVRAGDRALRRAVPEQLLRALVREQQLARRGLGDDHAERQLAHERGQALALAVRLLVERAVVERERDAARDLRGELPSDRRRAASAACHPKVSAPSVRPRTSSGIASIVRMPTRLAPRRGARGCGRRASGRSTVDATTCGTPVRIATATGVSLVEHGRVALQHARGLVHLRIGVDDDEPAHVVARHDVDDALVGERRHDEVGERAQRRVRLERARELLADRGQQAERAAPAPLGVVDARALERVGALLAERDRELALVVVEDVAALEAEAERAERVARRPAAAPTPSARRGRRSRGSGSRARPRRGRRAAALDGLADRRALRRAGSGARPRSPRR